MSPWGQDRRSQVSGFTALLTRVVQTAGILVFSACTCGAPPVAPPSSPPRTDEPALAEPISIRRGARELRVRCALACDSVRAELALHQRACASDPASTPHHVSDEPAMIALGCCTESESAYRDACGIEGLESCVSRWSAECASGRLSQ